MIGHRLPARRCYPETDSPVTPEILKTAFIFVHPGPQFLGCEKSWRRHRGSIVS